MCLKQTACSERKDRKCNRRELYYYTSHLSVVMATAQADDTQTTFGTTITPSSASVADFIFQCAVIIIGIVGAAANALVLYAMIVSKQHKKQLLIFNQNVFDLCSCLFLVVIYILKLCTHLIHLTGTLGYWLCTMLLSELLLWWSVNGSVINLLSIATERYLKVVHSSLSKKVLRKWVIYSAMAFPWIISTIFNMAVVHSTTRVIDGVCYAYRFWESRLASAVYGTWHFVSFFVVVLIGFIYCYGRILAVIRHQANVMAAHGSGSTASQAHSHQAKVNVTKTMILVCAFYVLSNLPDRVYYLLMNLNVMNLTLSQSSYYLIVFISFLYICTNPFIYATKFDPVRRVLLRLIVCRKSSVQPEAGE